MESFYESLLGLYRSGEALLADEKLRLAEALAAGGELPTDEEMARRLVGEAAEDGHPLAMLEMATREVSDGKLTPKSVEWLRRAVEAGEVQSMFLLAVALITGEGVDASDEAEGWLMMERAAERFHPEALYQMALRNREKGDMALAKYFEFEALDNGSEKAARAINHFFDTSDLDAEGNIDMAKVVEKAASRGNRQAMFQLANMEFRGQDDMSAGPSAKVVELLDKSVDAGFAEACVNRAEIALAKNDKTLAASLLERALESGHFAAKGILGRLLIERGDARRGRPMVVDALNFAYPPAMQLFAKEASTGKWPGMTNPVHGKFYETLFWQTLSNGESEQAK